MPDDQSRSSLPRGTAWTWCPDHQAKYAPDRPGANGPNTLRCSTCGRETTWADDAAEFAMRVQQFRRGVNAALAVVDKRLESEEGAAEIMRRNVAMDRSRDRALLARLESRALLLAALRDDVYDLIREETEATAHD